MVGYFKPNFKKMSLENKKIYKSFYCGLCKSLKKHYGYISIPSLNYEITSFLIVMSGLKSDKSKYFHGSCTISPFVPVTYINYLKDDLTCAASISLLIAHYEIKDNLIDDGGLKWKLLNNIIEKRCFDYNFIDKNDYRKIKDAVSMYYQMEKEENHTFYEMLSGSGNMVECLIAPMLSDYSIDVRILLLKLANLTGQWIYLIDACDDYKDDKKNFHYNPLFLVDDLSKVPSTLNDIENEITAIIKRLPFKHYRDLVENIFIVNIREISIRVRKKLFIV